MVVVSTYKTKLSAEEVRAVLQDTAAIFSWRLQRISEDGYSLTAPDWGTAYQVRCDPQESAITLYTPAGQIIDLSQDQEKHAAVHALIQREFQKSWRRRKNEHTLSKN